MENSLGNKPEDISTNANAVQDKDGVDNSTDIRTDENIQTATINGLSDVKKSTRIAKKSSCKDMEYFLRVNSFQSSANTLAETVDDRPNASNSSSLVSEVSNLCQQQQQRDQSNCNYTECHSSSPPTPPSISLLPGKRLSTLSQRQGFSHSAPSTPVRGKVVISKKERKQLGKLQKLPDTKSDGCYAPPNMGTVNNAPSTGPVNELRNCIAKLNSKCIFTALHRSGVKERMGNDYSANTPMAMLAQGVHVKNTLDHTEKLKNLPIRHRKTSHVDNYYLFDPVDFLDEKTLRKRALMETNFSNSARNSLQNLEFCKLDAAMPVPVMESKPDHHDYFIVDPGICETVPNHVAMDTKLPETEASLEILTDYPESLAGIVNVNSEDSTASTFSVELTTSTTLSGTSNTSFSSDVSDHTYKNPVPSNQKTASQFHSTMNTTRTQSHELHFSSTKEQTCIRHKRRVTSEVFTTDSEQRAHMVPDDSLCSMFNTCPLPNRSRLQCKSHRRRPFSMSSDVDSGFLSACTPDEKSSLSTKQTGGAQPLLQCDSVQDYIKIVIDWANYYLERSNSKKKVTDLSTDCRDGLLLADVIEAVTSFKVPDLIKKPKHKKQMFENVNTCLNVLRSQSVGGLENITTSDICAGSLKTVLALFFALSHYKQQTKNTDKQNRDDNMVNRQIPTVYTKINGGTAIPLPATVMVQRRCPPDKIRPLPPTPNQAPPVPDSDERESDYHKGIPKSAVHHMNPNQNPKSANNNGMRPAAPVCSTNNPGATSTTVLAATHEKQSMLGKLKFFHKEKHSEPSSNSGAALLNASKNQPQTKRVSSSSGFSSARSERSDSSLSLNDGANAGPKIQKTESVTVKNRAVKSTKQSKLMATQPKKEQSNASKWDKKEKSPVRVLKKKDGTVQGGNNSVGQQKKVMQLSGTETKASTSKTSANSNSEMKVSLLMPPSKSLSTSTGIAPPKPIAAIKGTTKLPQFQQLKLDKYDTNNIRPHISETNESNIKRTISSSNRHKAIDHNTSTFHRETFDSCNNGREEDNSGLAKHISNQNSDKFEYNGSRIMSPQRSPIKPLLLQATSSKTVGTIYEEEQSLSVMPMQMDAHAQLPPHKTRGTEYYASDYRNSGGTQTEISDADSIAISDERLRKSLQNLGPAEAMRVNDIDKGYLSDGSIGIGLKQHTLSGSHTKHLLSAMRKGTQLPPTIEERIQTSTGSLDCEVAIIPGSSGASAYSKVDKMNCGETGSSQRPHKRQDQGYPLPPQRHLAATARECSSKMPDPLSGRKYEKTEGKNSSGHSKAHSNERHHSVHNGNRSKMTSPTVHTRGATNNFGYAKRVNGEIDETNSFMSTVPCNIQKGRTSNVPALPRSNNGLKISDGNLTLPTNTTRCTSNYQHRSFSLTVPGAAQLSQYIRERLATGSHSLPKPGNGLNMCSVPSRRGTLTDGSLSDTQTYAEKKPEYNTYATWLKHSNTAGSRLYNGDSVDNMPSTHYSQNVQLRSVVGVANTSTIPNSVNRLGMTSDSPYLQSPRLNRSNSIRSTKSDKTNSSMIYRAVDGDIEPYYCLPIGSITTNNGPMYGQIPAASVSQSQGGSTCSSPTFNIRNLPECLSPTQYLPSTMSGVGNSVQRFVHSKNNDEVHGSTASLLSGGSSLYGSAEERQANEIRKLKRELMEAREQVLSLSRQLSTNAHVVTAFERSLANMTTRLHALTTTSERKDDELTDMRQTIELLRKQSVQAGLTTAHIQSMGGQLQQDGQNDRFASTNLDPHNRANTQEAGQQKVDHGAIQYKHNGKGTPLANTSKHFQRLHSSDSNCSLNSLSSGCSGQEKKKKKGWLRSSFTKAFSRNVKVTKPGRQSNQQRRNTSAMPINNEEGNRKAVDKSKPLSKCSNAYGIETNECPTVATQSPQLHTSSPIQGSPVKTVHVIEDAKPIDAINPNDKQVEELKKQLREKDLVLTDIRLEALTSASQLESLKETINKMQSEMVSLKQNNERLQRLVSTRSLASSEVSLGNVSIPSGAASEPKRFSLADRSAQATTDLTTRIDENVESLSVPQTPESPPPTRSTTHIDLTPPSAVLDTVGSPTHLPTTIQETLDVCDGKKIAIACYLGQPESFYKYCEEMLEMNKYYTNGTSEKEISECLTFPTISSCEFVIAYTYISGKTTWQNLDYIVRKTFKDYVSRIDPGSNLGLNTDSITSYHLGEAKRGPEMGFPELLPCGYIIGNVRTLYICLQGVGSLAFDSLIPRSIIHRYISLLTEHRRLILCGPSGTGKSYLARKLAEFLVAKSGRGNPSEAIATFNVDHKSNKDLRQYLSHFAEQAAIANGASELPSVIILDNLHFVSALDDVFSCLLSSKSAIKLPCIIGTMSQATCNTANLQLHHNFRWVLTANHMEPVKGFLGRYLRRRLFRMELETQQVQPELAAVLSWLTVVWQHINRFLDMHSSSDVTIGPRLFLGCPMDLKESQVWFTDIWNHHITPYLIGAVRDGVQLYGKRAAWDDPSVFIRSSYPWPYGPDTVPPLRQIHAKDVGLEGVTINQSGDNTDPLLNMLMHLQEAANYSEIPDQESDRASLDSNSLDSSLMPCAK